MTLTECQSFLLRLTAIEDNTKIREERILKTWRSSSWTSRNNSVKSIRQWATQKISQKSQWVQRRGLLLAGTWRLNPKFKTATGRSLEYEALRGTPSWQARQKQSPTSHCSLHVSCWQRSRLEGSLQAEKLAYFNGWRPTEAHTRNQKKRPYHDAEEDKTRNT